MLAPTVFGDQALSVDGGPSYADRLSAVPPTDVIADCARPSPLPAPSAAADRVARLDALLRLHANARLSNVGQTVAVRVYSADREVCGHGS